MPQETQKRTGLERIPQTPNERIKYVDKNYKKDLSRPVEERTPPRTPPIVRGIRDSYCRLREPSEEEKKIRETELAGLVLNKLFANMEAKQFSEEPFTSDETDETVSPARRNTI